MAENLITCATSHVPSPSADIMWKSENVISKAKFQSTSIFRSILELQFTGIEKEFKVKELEEYLEIKKKKMLDLQMENENLSQDVKAEQDHRSEIIPLIMCQCHASEMITSHIQNLNCFGEQLKDVKQELLNQNKEYAKDLSKMANDINVSFQQENLELLNSVKEKLKQLQEEDRKITLLHNEIQNKINDVKRELENIEKECMLMKSHYEEVLRQKDEEKLAYDKDKYLTNEALTSLISKNIALEESVSINSNMKNSLETLLKESTTKKDSIQDKTIELESIIKEELAKQKDLISMIEELDRNIAESETEITLNHELLKQKEEENLELIKQRGESDQNLHLIQKALEEAKELSHTMESDLKNVISETVNAESMFETVDQEYKSKTSERRHMLDFLTQETIEIQSEIKSIENTFISLQEQVEKKMEQVKFLQIKENDLKKTVEQEVFEIKSLQTIISEKDAQHVEMKMVLEEKQIMTEKRKAELDHINKLHKEYEHILQGIEESRQKTATLQEKREKFESEMNEKRKNLMEHLDECRNDTLKLTNKLEAELMEDKKEISDLKENIKQTAAEMDSQKKGQFTKKCALLNKMKQLESELQLEIQAKVYKNYVDSPETFKSRTELHHASQDGLPVPIKQNKCEETAVASESDQSTIDITVNELMKMAKKSNAINFSSKTTEYSDTIKAKSARKYSKKRKERDILDIFDSDF